VKITDTLEKQESENGKGFVMPASFIKKKSLQLFFVV